MALASIEPRRRSHHHQHPRVSSARHRERPAGPFDARRRRQRFSAHLYLLDDAWTPEQVIGYAQRGVERAVDLQQAVPIHVLYWTAFIGDDEELHFAPDVYDRDPILDRAMAVRPSM